MNSRRGRAVLARTRALVIAASVVLAPARRAAGAEGARSRVTVVRAASSDPLIREANTRLRAELAAAGFDVLDVDGPAGSVRDEVESTSEATKSFATVAIERAGTGASADVWISDLVTGKTVVRRLRVGSESNAAAVLAIRALELLRASLLEVTVPVSEAPDEAARRAAPPDVVSWAEPKTKARGPSHPLAGTSMAVGVFVLHSLQSIGPSLGPVARVARGIGPRVFGRLSLASAVVGPRVHAEGGEASVQQHFGSLELGWVADTRPVVAFAWAGIGAYYLRTSGEAEAPFRASSAGVVSALGTVGVGGLVRLGRGVTLSADVAAIGLVPQPVVVIANHDAGTAGAPSLAAALSLLVEL